MYYFEKSNNKMTSLYVVYNAGSMYENENQHGTMHLMEHLMCRRFDHLQDKYTNLNIYFNAYTTAQQVIIHINGINNALTKEIKKEFIDILCNNQFVSADIFNKEKSIVMQEYYNYFNDISYGNSINYIRKKYNNYSAIGKAQDIINFTYSDALEIFAKFFSKPTDIVEIAKEMTDFSDVEYNNIPLSDAVITFNDYDVEIEAVPESDINSQIIIGCKNCISKEDYPLFAILIDILSSGLNSILYQELREKRGLIYAISFITESCVNDSIFLYSIMTTPDNSEEVVKIVKNVFTNLEDYITEQRFNDIINCLKIQIDINKIYKYTHPKSLNINLPKGFNDKRSIRNVKLVDIINIGKKYFSDIDISIN